LAYWKRWNGEKKVRSGEVKWVKNICMIDKYRGIFLAHCVEIRKLEMGRQDWSLWYWFSPVTIFGYVLTATWNLLTSRAKLCGGHVVLLEEAMNLLNLCHGEDFKSSSKYNTCTGSIFFWIVAASGNNQLPCPLYLWPVQKGK
jgi:hypothetical protein